MVPLRHMKQRPRWDAAVYRSGPPAERSTKRYRIPARDAKIPKKKVERNKE